jgi:hypothetical protein
VAVSHQDGACPSRGLGPVVPYRTGARQDLIGEVGSGHPACGWGSAGPKGQWAQREGWISQRAVGPALG